MRSNLFLIACLILFCFTSCQKSIEWNDLVLTPTAPVTPAPGGTTSSLLVKLVTLSNTDTLTYNYTYDAANKLVKITTVGLSNGSKVDDLEVLVRDANGRLTQYNKISYSSTSTNASGYDTTITKVHYPTNSNNFDYTISNAFIGGFYLTDSTTYTYVNGKIAQLKLYYSNALTLGQSILAIESNYIYDANGNVALLKNYDYTTSTTPTLYSELAYTFDNKKSPLMLGNEAIVINADVVYIGANNGLSASYKDYSSTQSSTANISYTYSYNTNGYPTQANGTGSSSSSNIPTMLQAFYFYQ
jgi:YD repeat-containing protein